MVRLRHFSKSRVLYIVMICDFRVELLGSFVLVCSGADAEGLHNRCEREQVCAMHSGENQTDGLRQRRYHLPARYLRLGQYWRGDRLGDGLPGGDNGTGRHGADGGDAGSEGLVESCTSTAPRPASKARNSRNPPPPLDHEQFAMATGGRTDQGRLQRSGDEARSREPGIRAGNQPGAHLRYPGPVYGHRPVHRRTQRLDHVDHPRDVGIRREPHRHPAR